MHRLLLFLVSTSLIHGVLAVSLSLSDSSQESVNRHSSARNRRPPPTADRRPPPTADRRRPPTAAT
jgi:hypothetical protein